jgi:hypothetical protein
MSKSRFSLTYDVLTATHDVNVPWLTKLVHIATNEEDIMRFSVIIR